MWSSVKVSYENTIIGSSYNGWRKRSPVWTAVANTDYTVEARRQRLVLELVGAVSS